MSTNAVRISPITALSYFESCQRTEGNGVGQRQSAAVYVAPFGPCSGITSRLAVVLLMSAETDNLLLAVLSAGPVGLGDAVGLAR